MRKLKAIFSVILTLCLLLTTCSVAFAAETENTEAWLTIHGNGGSFAVSYVDEGGVHTNPSRGYDSFPVEEGMSLTDAGIEAVSDPRQSGKDFLGWVAYHKDTAEENFGAPIDGNVLTTEEVMNYAAVSGYTDFIAKWDGEEIDPNNAGVAGEPEMYYVTFYGSGISFYYDFANTLQKNYMTATAAIEKNAEASLFDYGYSFGYKNENVQSTHADRFYGWDAYTVDENGNETLVEEMVSEDEISTWDFTSDMKFVARWPNGYVAAKTDWEKNVTFEVGEDSLLTIETKTDNITDGYIAEGWGTVEYYIEDGFTLAESNVIAVWASVEPNSWLMYTGSNTEPDREIFSEEELLNIPISGTTRFVGNYDEAVFTTVVETDIVPVFTSIDNGGGDISEDHYLGKMSHEINRGQSLAESGISVWYEDIYTPYLLGWYVNSGEMNDSGEFAWSTVTNDSGSPLLLSTEEMLAYPITGHTLFSSLWEENFDGDVNSGTGLAVSFNLDAAMGTFDLTDTFGVLEDSSFTRFDMDVFEGTTLKDLGVIEISDIKYWDNEREFLGWNVYRTDVVYGEYDEDVYYEDVLLTEEPISTAEVLEYPAIDGQLTFRCVWAGDDSDYVVDVNFWALGGTYSIAWDINNIEESTETTDHTGFSCVKNDDTLIEQLQVAILSDPVREGYTFEGWLALPTDMNQRYKASTTLYTTEELLSLPVPEYSTEYTAKWKEYPIDYYLYSDPLWEADRGDDFSELQISANGGQITVQEIYDDGSENEYTWEYTAYHADAGMTFAETDKDNYGCEIVSMEASKDLSTLEGWTTYLSDRIYWLVLEEGETVSITDPTITVIPFLKVEDYISSNGETVNATEYLLLKNATVYSETLTPFEAINLSDGCYTMVANWADWAPVEVEGSEEKYMLDINMVGLAVPTAAAEKYATVEEAKTALKEAALTVSSINKDKATTVYYEITLKVQKDDGTWEIVTPENFPKDGVKVVIPYNGLDPEALDFVVTHLISSGDKAGEIEVLKHTEGENGLEATVYSLSPFAVTYQKTEDAVVTVTPDKNPNNVPPTGDTNALFFFLAVTSAAAAALFVTVKKLRRV